MQTILLINYEYPPVGGGAAYAAFSIAQSLSRRKKARLAVLTTGFKSLKGWTNEQGISIYRCGSLRRRADRSTMLEKISFVLAAFIALPRIIRKIKPSGVIAFFSLPCGPIGLFACLRYGIPYLVSLRGGDVPGMEKSLAYFHAITTPIRRVVLRKSIAVVANSQGLAAASYKADPVKVRIINNGVDTDYFTLPNDSHRSVHSFMILFVGRFQEQKNCSLIIRQSARIRTMIAPLLLELHLAGDGPLYRDCRALATALHLDDAVQWHGWIDKAELINLYHRADCFINASLYEGFSNSMLEAMACGVPVVASNVTGNNELVIDGETGYLFDLSSPDRCGDRLIHLSSHRSLASRLGSQARKRAVTTFSWDRASDEYLSLFGKH